MGLDCTAYEKVTLVEAISLKKLKDGNWEHPLYDDGGHVFLFNADFPERSDGLVEGFYRTEGESMGWRAGSYSGYNRYRELLGQIVDVDVRAVWAEPDKFKNKPFVEQINFADNEGFLGPQTCKALLGDYKEIRPKAMALFEKMWKEDLERAKTASTSAFMPLPPREKSWLAEVYDEWIQALEMAAGNGVIRYH